MEPCLSTAQVQLWGGVECTVNRIGDQYFNQLDVSGHSSRLEDLELFADLGIRVLRYPYCGKLLHPGDSTKRGGVGPSSGSARCAPSVSFPSSDSFITAAGHDTRAW